MSLEHFETKAAFTVSDAGEITGTAWVFGEPDRVRDRITKGAFAGATTPIPMLFGHDPNDVVGVWTEITETDDALIVKGQLFVDEVQRAREVRTMILKGAVSGLSVGFSIVKAIGRKGLDRVISALGLHEISIVSIPAHPCARITEAKRLTSVADASRLAAVIHDAAQAIRSNREV